MACDTVIVLDLCPYAGDSYEFGLLWQDSSKVPVDLTGFTARMQARPNASSADPPLFSKTELDGITLGGVAGTVDVLLGPSDTDQTGLNNVWDIELTSPAGIVTTLARGDFTITRDVTRG